mmetsp:Transcript_65161/g.74886  ORF Transcript_65161/g.74886 Transcript_65161/m.74886 type:complete len:128 (-) Transcript_65161:1649-2032(-)
MVFTSSLPASLHFTFESSVTIIKRNKKKAPHRRSSPGIRRTSIFKDNAALITVKERFTNLDQSARNKAYVSFMKSAFTRREKPLIYLQSQLDGQDDNSFLQLEVISDLLTETKDMSRATSDLKAGIS